MNQKANIIKHLPIEIIQEIFAHLLLHHPAASAGHCDYNKMVHQLGQAKPCICWQLDILSVSMVCKSWYLVSLELLQSRQVLAMSNNNTVAWLPLVNHAGYQRDYPFRARLTQLLKESCITHCVFHRQVECLVIDFASFNTIHREKLKSGNAYVIRKTHHANALADMIELIHLCRNTQRLNIVCDAEFSSLLAPDEETLLPYENSILFNSQMIQKAINQSALAVKRLDFVGYRPIQRCPCCASKKWDMHLKPLIQSLPYLETLVLQHVLPSVHVFQQLAMNPRLEKIVFYKSIVTVSSDNRANTKPAELVTSINQIPDSIWHNIKSIEIYEDIEDAATWKSERYLNELVSFVSPQLERFVLQFETKMENERCIEQGFSQKDDHTVVIRDPKSPLHALKVKCKDTLKQIALINVPVTYFE